MRRLTPLVQPLSIDEAWLDLSGTERLHGAPPAAAAGRGWRARSRRRLGITVSIGLGHNKFLAKIASDLDKPRGFAVIGRAEAAGFLADKPVGWLWGVGRRDAAPARRRRHHAGRPAARARRRANWRGAMAGSGCGWRSWRAARTTAASIPRAAPARSRPRPPSRATRPIAEALARVLWPLCEKVAPRLKQSGLAAGSVTLKLKTADFRLRTRSRRLADPTQLADALFRTARHLLAAKRTASPGSA